MGLAKRHLKYPLIRAGLEVSAIPGLSAIWPKAAGRGVIFTLHHVRPCDRRQSFDPNAVLSVTPEFLDAAISTALRCGLTPVHLHDLPQRLADADDHRRFVAFTLDDGYRNNAQWAAPIFARYQVPYTIFITAGFVERSRSLWWETIEAVLRKVTSLSFDFGNGMNVLLAETTAQKQACFERFAGFVRSVDENEAVARIDALARQHEIDPLQMVADLVMDATELRELGRDPLVHFGAHSLTHANLKRVSDTRLNDEVTGSARAVETYVGQKPLSFSYPYGWKSAVGLREMAIVEANGFKAGVTTQPGVLNRESLNAVSGLPRVSLNGLYQKPRYVKALISGLPFKLL